MRALLTLVSAASRRAWHGVTSRWRPSEALFFAVSVLALAPLVHHVQRLQRVDAPPPPDALPELAFSSTASHLVPAGTIGVSARVVVGLRSCDEPVDVRAFLTYDEALLRRHPRLLASGTAVGIAVYPPVRGPISLYQGSSAGLSELSRYGNVIPPNISFLARGRTSVATEGDLGPSRHYTIAVQRESIHGPMRMSALTARVAEPARFAHGAGVIRPIGLAARFQANWTRFRSDGTCYVMLPALLGVSAFETQVGSRYALGRPEAPFGPEPAVASVRLEAAVGVELNDARPPPDDFRDARWWCKTRTTATQSYAADRCEGVVPYAEPGASTRTSNSVLLYGVLIGVVSAVAVEMLLRLIPSRQ